MSLLGSLIDDTIPVPGGALGAREMVGNLLLLTVLATGELSGTAAETREVVFA